MAEYDLSLRSTLGEAADRGELRLDYQPIVSTVEGRIDGVEALLRWDHPTRGPIAPAVMIPLAEQSGQIIEIGRWVLEHACAEPPDGGSSTTDRPSPWR